MFRPTLALRQLAVLTAIHFMVDMLSGTLPGFLPRLLQKYSLSIGAGTVLLTLCAFSANAIQIWAGTLRKTATHPRLIQLGLLLACVVCLVGLIPAGPGAMFWLIALVLTLGTGVAMVHPEGLRSICTIDQNAISPSVATSVFMLAGFLGCSSGPLISGLLIENLDFPGLYLLLIPAGILIWLLARLKIRLAANHPEESPSRPAAPAAGAGALTFRELFVIAILINTGSTIMQGLLPTFLNEQYHFTLTFSGLSAMLFGAGAGTGALTTSFLAGKYDVIKCIRVELAAGIPLLTGYLLLAGSPAAAPLVFAAGALVGAGFPQLVVLARSVPGKMALGTRMGLIVGGSWAIAGLFLLLVGYFADTWGIHPAMFLSPVAFLGALAACHMLLRRSHTGPKRRLSKLE